ncbi:MAG: GNAT family N-acetyltransferase [Chitinophagales bacterium]|nr:GNAT family N-acetyltransferase [Chitinophagales bacterium]
MRIRKYGISLVRLTHDHIELVRQWRNAPRIREFMEYRETITPEMQQRWFEQLDPVCDFYFIIEYHEQLVGLIHTSGIDWKVKSGHAGLFIHKNELLGSPVPVLASLSMVDFFFTCCKLETLHAKVMGENPVAIRYNARLGFKPSEPQSEKRFRNYALAKQDYITATAQLHLLTKALHDEIYVIEMEPKLFVKLKSNNALQLERLEKVLRLTD